MKSNALKTIETLSIVRTTHSASIEVASWCLQETTTSFVSDQYAGITTLFRTCGCHILEKGTVLSHHRNKANEMVEVSFMSMA